MFDLAPMIDVDAQFHPLKRDRKTFQVGLGAAITDIVRAADLDPKFGLPTVLLSKGDTVWPVASDQWKNVRPKVGTTVLIVHQVEGGLLVAALSNLIAAAAPTIVGSLFPTLTGLGFKIAVAAVTVIGGLALNALIPPAKQSGLGTQDPSQQSITGFQNQIDRFGAMPKVLGRRRVFPKMMSRGYTETVDGEIYYRGRFAFGWATDGLELDDIRIGDTPIHQFEGIELEFLNIDETRTLANYPELSSITRAWRSGDDLMTLCPDDVTESSYSVLLAQSTAVVRGTSTRAESVGIDVTFPQGLYEQSTTDASVRLTRTHTFSFRYREDGEVTWVDGGSMTVTSKQNSQFRKTHEIQFPSVAEYEVEITQDTANNTDSNFSDKAYLTSVRTFRTGELPSYANVAEIAIRVKASDQLNGQVDSLNAIAQQLGKEWNGSSFGSVTAIRHPAWVLADALRGAHLKSPVADSKINLDALKDWADDEGHWTCDFVVDSETRLRDVLDIICAAGRAKFSLTDLQYSVLREQPSAPTRQMFTPRNSWGFSSQIVFPKTIHALRCKVISEQKDWQEDEIIVYADGYTESNATVFETLDLPGVVVTADDNDQTNVWRLGRYHIAVSQLRRETYEWFTDFEHLSITRGDKVTLVHDVPLIGIGAARIKSIVVDGGGITSFTLDDIMPGASGNYRVTIRYEDGDRAELVMSAPADETTKVWTYVSGAISSSDINVGDLVVIEETAQDRSVVIVTGVFPDQGETARITAVDEASGVTTADSGTIPAYSPTITPAPNEAIVGPALPVIDAIVSDASTELVDATGKSNRRIGVFLDPSATNIQAGAFLQLRWRSENEETYTVGPFMPIETRELFTGILDRDPDYDIGVRSIGPVGRTRGWVTTTGVSDGATLTAPLAPVYDAADTPSGTDVKNLVSGKQITIRWEHRLVNDDGAAVFAPKETEVWRSSSATLTLSGGEPTNATKIGVSLSTEFIDATSQYQNEYYYFLRAVAQNGSKSDFDSGRKAVTGTSADNRVANPDFAGGASDGWNLYSDNDEPTNPLSVTVVERNESSDFIPESTCPFPGMIKIAMGEDDDSVAKYEVNSGDTANSDYPIFDYEHVLLDIDGLVPVQAEQDVVVSFSMAESGASVTNGWTDDGDYGPTIRMYFYDADGTKITAGRDYTDAYAGILGATGSGLDVWQRRSATFSPPSNASFCSFEVVGLGNATGQAIGFGVSYMSGFEIRSAAGTQSLGRGSIHVQGEATGSDLAPSTDNTAEVVLTYTITIPDLPANATSGEDVTIKAKAGGTIVTSGGETVEFFIRLDAANGNSFETSTQMGLSLSDTFTVSAGSSYTIDLTMESTDVTVTELDNAHLDIEATLR